MARDKTGATIKQGKALETLAADWSERAVEGFDQSLQTLQREAFERFTGTGFPGPRAEAWRQINMTTLARRPLSIARPQLAVLDDEVLAAVTMLEEDGPAIVVVNGRYQPDLGSATLVGGIEVTSLAAGTLDSAGAAAAITADAVREPWAFRDLNTALAPDVVRIAVAPGTNADRPLQIIHINSAGTANAVACPLVEIDLGENAAAVVAEHYLTGHGERPLTVASTRLALGRGARLDYYQVDHAPAEAGRIGCCEAAVSGDAALCVRGAVLDLGLVRSDVIVDLTEPGADFRFEALALAAAQQHIEYLVNAEHRAPRTTSDQVFKGIGSGRSRSVFTSRAAVYEDAQHISSHQLARGLLLSPDAQINTRPQLEIYADDVQCAHGATVGQLDDDALFYLRSRGVPEAAAKAMLIDAFAQDLIETIALKNVAERARRRAYSFTHGDAADAPGETQ